MPRKDFIICLVFSLWTIIQTGFHLVFAIYGYYMSICQKTPTQAPTIFFYLTYLYNKECSAPHLKSPEVLNSRPLEAYISGIISSLSTVEAEISLEEIVQDLLKKLDFFPDFAAASTRASVFLLCFIILDGAWLISTVSLLMGTCFGIKQSLSLAFYGPWLVMTICVCIFDAAASVLFGLDIAETTDFKNWLTFVGVNNTSAFDMFISKNPSLVFPVAPSISFCSVSSRFAIIWVSNWVGIFYVLKATISVYHETYKKEEMMRRRPRTFIESPVHQNRTLNLDSSAARIRSWQLFYGAIDTTSTHSSKSEKDLSLNNNNKDNGEGQHEKTPSGDGENKSTFYYAYPDVAASVVVGDGGCLDELRGQLPWSYIPPQTDATGGCSGEGRIELQNMTRKNYRTKSDASISSCTDL